MTKTKTQNKKTLLKNQTKLKTIIAVATSTLLITACSSTCKKQNLTIETLNKQSELITKLQEERSQEELKRKLSQDSDIKAAEGHLNEAIEALQKSNEVIKESVSKN